MIRSGTSMAELQERAVPMSAQLATDCAVGTRMLTLHLLLLRLEFPKCEEEKKHLFEGNFTE
jgi:hypothetical protein